MSKKSKREYLLAIRERYRQASKPAKTEILNELCSVCHYECKHAIKLLHQDRRTLKKKPGPSAKYNEFHNPHSAICLVPYIIYINLSNRSFFTLQMGHTSGACSRAHRYPHTLQRQTGSGSLKAVPFFCPAIPGEALPLRSGMRPSFFFPCTMSWET